MSNYKKITNFYAMLKLCRVWRKWQRGGDVSYDIYKLIDLADFFPKYQIEQAISIFDEEFQKLVLKALLLQRFIRFEIRK